MRNRICSRKYERLPFLLATRCFVRGEPRGSRTVALPASAVAVRETSPAGKGRWGGRSRRPRVSSLLSCPWLEDSADGALGPALGYLGSMGVAAGDGPREGGRRTRLGARGR